MAEADSSRNGTSEAPAPKRRGFPFIPTMMVAIAVPMMLAFGTWQLQRMQWKQALLVQLAENSALPVTALPATGAAEALYFRQMKADISCQPSPDVRAGRNLEGQSGYTAIYSCTGNGRKLEVHAGWSPRPEMPAGQLPPSGTHKGRLAPPSPSGKADFSFYLDSATPPLLPSAAPGMESISNNHLSYAIQWFSFAAILSIIYGLWLRRWLAPSARQG